MKFLFSIVLHICLLLLVPSCAYQSREYQKIYAHLQTFQPPCCQSMEEDDYFLIILVDACHLDYSDACKFFKSVFMHSNGSRRGDVGHAWIYLQCKRNGRIFRLEGGHSGEIEEPPARYFDGIMNYNDWGYSNPTKQQKSCPRHEPDPIKYLWTMREDGFFQKGSGGHCPTFAAKISLSKQQFERILSFVRPSRYPYQHYSLLGPQCCTFAAQVAALAGVSLSTQITMQIAPSIFYGKTWIRLWKDPRYSTLTFSTPDMLEKSLMKAVENGEAEYALDWYLQRHIIK